MRGRLASEWRGGSKERYCVKGEIRFQPKTLPVSDQDKHKPLNANNVLVCMLLMLAISLSHLIPFN